MVEILKLLKLKSIVSRSYLFQKDRMCGSAKEKKDRKWWQWLTGLRTGLSIARTRSFKAILFRFIVNSQESLWSSQLRTYFAMDPAYPEVPVEMLKHFHSLDRELYSILVFELERDPKVSVNTIALWIWLELDVLDDVVPNILLSSIKSINGLADEALVCLRCITDATYLSSSDASEISLSQSVLGEQLSLKFFHENRAQAYRGVRSVVENVCVKVLDDLMGMAMTRNTERQALKTQMVMIPPVEPMMPRFGGLTRTGESSRSVLPPMDSMVSRFGGIRLTGESSQSVVPPVDPMIQRFGGLKLTGESSQSAVPPLHMEEPKENRTVFATFSRGYPVFEWELRSHFYRMFGHCVESITMQPVKPNEQSLFALVVFTSPAIVDLVLRGMEKAKFMVKGKQVWMRKYARKA
nr:uncharacterized protein LOC109168955 [Ipomoea batatas]